MMNTAAAEGARLAQKRRDAGISQARLAGLAGCSRSSVVLTEGGYVPQRSEVIPRIERVLDALLDDNAPAGTGARSATATDAAGARDAIVLGS